MEPLDIRTYDTWAVVASYALDSGIWPPCLVVGQQRLTIGLAIASEYLQLMFVIVNGGFDDAEIGQCLN